MLRKNAEQRHLTAHVGTAPKYPMPPKPAASRPGLGCAVFAVLLVGLVGVVYRGCFSVDPHAGPAVSTIDLGALDPSTTHIVPGSVSGHVDSSAFGAGCRGTFERSPTYVLHVREASMVTIATQNGEDDDRTMALRAPDGTVLCDDDSGGAMNPQLRVALGPGDYPVWVGIYDDDTMSTSFRFSVRQERVPGMVPPRTVVGGGSGTREPMTTSMFGAPATGGAELVPTGAGRLESQGIAGGAYDVSSLGAGCRGYVPRAPQKSFTSSDAMAYTFTTTNTSDADLVMLVRDANGRILCDDDSGEDQNPRMSETFPPGRVDVWVGALHDDLTAVYSMSADYELAPDGPMEHGLAILSPSRLGTLVPEAARLPYAAEASSTGRVNGNGIASGCNGAFPVASTLMLDVHAPTLLTVYTESTTDLVMAVHHPDGTWECNDDSIGNQPRVHVTFSEGEHRIWVGTYTDGESSTFTLHVDPD